jgi:hypothetical protein
MGEGLGGVRGWRGGVGGGGGDCITHDGEKYYWLDDDKLDNRI